MSGPIKPEEVENAKIISIPDAVFDVFNELIIKDMSSGVATVRQEEAVKLIAERCECEPQKIYDNRWLDIEEAYRRVGWKVEYDKPAYNENYPALFRFQMKKK